MNVSWIVVVNRNWKWYFDVFDGGMPRLEEIRVLCSSQKGYSRSE